MADQFTRVTSQSLGNRLGKALGGIGGGFVLVIAAIAGLAWNESRAVQTARALTEGAGAVLTIDAEGSVFDAGGNDVTDDVDTAGRLIHVHGELWDTLFPFDDELQAVDPPRAATRLTRVVEMYQWVENKKDETRTKVGGGTETVTTYTYSREWVARHVDSGRFGDPTGHQNPPMPLDGKVFTSEKSLDTGITAMTVPDRYVAQLGKDAPLPMTADGVELVARKLGTALPAHLAQGAAVFGADPARPEIGDFRVSYKVATATEASVVAREKGGDLAPWRSSNGRELFIIREGDVPAAQMFEEEQASNAMMTWGLRGAGFLAMLAGFRAIFAIIGVLADIIPPLGAIARFATGLVSLALTLVIAPLTIGLAWLAVRPLLGGAIIGAGLLLALGAWMLARRRRTAAAPAAPPPAAA